jgi:phosphatidylserine decarboxylase
MAAGGAARRRASLAARMFVGAQYLLPQHALSRLVRCATHSRWRWLKNLLIRGFMRAYHPDLSDAELGDPLGYPSFNAFFTRRLRAGARSFERPANCVCSPVDGTLSMAGPIVGNTLVQAKGRDYTLGELLAGDAGLVARYRGGLYATLYLAPHNYHRIHMPLAGALRSAWLVPGRLFSVNAATAAGVPRLYARNERVVCDFEGSGGPFAVVLVGALNVGNLQTVWHGELGAHRRAAATRLPEVPAPLCRAERGAELGCFNMGSTVIVLLGPGTGSWLPGLSAGAVLRAGEPLGALAGAP